MATLVTKTLADSGAVPAFDPLADTSNTAEYGNGRNTFLVLRNTNASTRTVNITVAGVTDYSEPLPDRSFNLAANTGELWVPLRRAYADPNIPGRVTFTVSAVDGVSTAVVRVS